MAELLSAKDVHRIAAGRWPIILAELGVDERYLSPRHGPCPMCGGKDRFRFDDRDGRGTWICNRCGAGDGFRLLQEVYGWRFHEALRAVAGMVELDAVPAPASLASTERPFEHESAPTRIPARVREILRTSAPPELVPDAKAYLRRRHCWPLPRGCPLRAHTGIDYFRPLTGKAYELVGRFPVLLAPVHDLDGRTVTAHVTFLEAGEKAPVEVPRKILSGLSGRLGCAVRLMPFTGTVLGIAEGIETALAASKLHGVPVWAALNATLLGKFVPPPEIDRVLVFVDNDEAGMRAATNLRDRLEGRCSVEMRIPDVGDWWDVLNEDVNRA